MEEKPAWRASCAVARGKKQLQRLEEGIIMATRESLKQMEI